MEEVADKPSHRKDPEMLIQRWISLLVSHLQSVSPFAAPSYGRIDMRTTVLRLCNGRPLIFAAFKAKIIVSARCSLSASAIGIKMCGSTFPVPLSDALRRNKDQTFMRRKHRRTNDVSIGNDRIGKNHAQNHT